MQFGGSPHKIDFVSFLSDISVILMLLITAVLSVIWFPFFIHLIFLSSETMISNAFFFTKKPPSMLTFLQVIENSPLFDKL